MTAVTAAAIYARYMEENRRGGMSNNPFRHKPYMDAGIDTLKVLLMAVLFLVLVTALALGR